MASLPDGTVQHPCSGAAECGMVPPMEPTADGAVLRDFFERGDHRLIHKWMHFFEIYDRHFAKFRGKPVSVLELGVYHGGSLQMWKHYFGEQARIFGADIDPRCAAVAAHSLPRLVQDVIPAQLVVQRMEAPCRRPLGCGPKLPLQLSHVFARLITAGVVRSGLAGHSLALTRSSIMTTAGTLPSSRVMPHGLRGP